MDWIHQSKGTQCLDGFKKKKARPSYMWSTEHILALKTQNGSKERMDDNISSSYCSHSAQSTK